MMKISFPELEVTIDVYMDILRAICGDTKSKSMIDLCCNTAPHTPLLGFDKRCYIDILPRVLDHLEEQQFFINKNVLKITPLLTEVFDVAICSDGIEHLYKKDGGKLVLIMQQISLRQIFFTPMTAWQMTHDLDPEMHHSLWKPEDFGGYYHIILPKCHSSLGLGAFFSWRCDNNMYEDFFRVLLEISKTSWHQDSKHFIS